MDHAPPNPRRIPHREPRRERRAAPRAAIASAVALLSIAACALSLAPGCALPGRPVRVLPQVEGALVPGTPPIADARLTLVVQHRESASLHARQTVPVAPDGRFRFEPVSLAVAGHEFSKVYRVYLHLEHGAADRAAASDRVIWRAELSRFDDEIPIRLACDLARDVALGEPCRVVDPLAQPWLLAEGRRHYKRLCADCHGRDGRGQAAPSPATDASTAADGDAQAADRAHAAPDLTRIAARHAGRFDRDAVAAFIEGRALPAGHAREGMPVWGERLAAEFERYAEGDELIGATLDPLVAHLESIQRPD